MIAIDATGHLAFKGRHCPHCLTKEKDTKILYYYNNVLEAKIVTAVANRIANWPHSTVW